MTPDNNELGKILKRQRNAMELTLRELAATSGISSSHLGRIERGERFPSAHILRKLSKPFGFEENELFTLAGYLSRQDSTAESETYTGRLDPYVARVLAQEPVEVQRTLVGILSVLKSLAKV